MKYVFGLHFQLLQIFFLFLFPNRISPAVKHLDCAFTCSAVSPTSAVFPSSMQSWLQQKLQYNKEEQKFLFHLRGAAVVNHSNGAPLKMPLKSCVGEGSLKNAILKLKHFLFSGQKNDNNNDDDDDDDDDDDYHHHHHSMHSTINHLIVFSLT